MARLDAVIERLFNERAVELYFETGVGAVMRFKPGAGAEVPVIRSALTTQQIIGAFTEIAPDELRGKFPPPNVTNFPYTAPTGNVLVRFENAGDKMRARITPAVAEKAPTDSVAPDEAAPPEGHAAPPPAAAAPAVQASHAPKTIVDKFEGAANGDPKSAMLHLLEVMLDRRASDLHLASQNFPMVRVDGDITPFEGWPKLTHDRLKSMLWTMAPERNKQEWEEKRDTDFAYETPRARFRVNVFMDRKGIGAVLRQIPTNIMSAEKMGLSKHIMDLCYLTKGLVLVTGPTGSGKSTTLAAMIDHINRNREDHIITIEDPIEFVHDNQKCLVNQREINVHTQSFKNALRAALREDPDIVLVGELRDLETIAIAIETAETGHLVFGTLHTNTAPSTVDRIIDQFPADRQSQIRTMLSESLKGVIAQTLCKKIGGGRAAAQEVLICTSSVANLIREGKTFQIPSAMQTGRGVGMVTLNDALFDLVKSRTVEPLEAYMKSVHKSEMKTMLERGGFQVNLPSGG